jgi:hypothetical protein
MTLTTRPAILSSMAQKMLFTKTSNENQQVAQQGEEFDPSLGDRKRLALSTIGPLDG